MRDYYSRYFDFELKFTKGQAICHRRSCVRLIFSKTKVTFRFGFYYTESLKVGYLCERGYCSDIKFLTKVLVRVNPSSIENRFIVGFNSFLNRGLCPKNPERMNALLHLKKKKQNLVPKFTRNSELFLFKKCI